MNSSVRTFIDTADSGAQLAKNSEYSFGDVIGYEWVKDE